MKSPLLSLSLVIVSLTLAMPARAADAPDLRDIGRAASFADFQAATSALFQQKNPVTLARELLSQDDPELIKSGLAIVFYHRLATLSRQIGRIAEAADEQLSEKALRTLLFSGATLQDSLASVASEPLKIRIIEIFGSHSGLLDAELDQRNRLAVMGLLHHGDVPATWKRAALLSLAAVRHRLAQDHLLLPLDEWLDVAASFDLSDSDRVSGIVMYDAPDVPGHLRHYLKTSADPAARVQAAAALALNHHDPAAIDHLINLLPAFDTEMDVWGSVGLRAFWALMSIDDAIIISKAIDGLKTDNPQILAQLLGVDDAQLITLARVQKLLTADAPSLLQQRKQLAQLISNWLRDHKAQLNFEVSRPQPVKVALVRAHFEEMRVLVEDIHVLQKRGVFRDELEAEEYKFSIGSLSDVGFRLHDGMRYFVVFRVADGVWLNETHIKALVPAEEIGFRDRPRRPDAL